VLRQKDAYDYIASVLQLPNGTAHFRVRQSALKLSIANVEPVVVSKRTTLQSRMGSYHNNNKQNHTQSHRLKVTF
jgi:hypothetical protein